jgi:aminoglycoside phosphotransferase (APT) family kinase protein
LGVEQAADGDIAPILTAFGIGSEDSLGHGGEARVFAFGDDRILRVLRPGGRAADLLRRRDLVAELVRALPPFALPEILDVGQMAGHVYAVERRLPGRPLSHALRSCHGEARRHLVEHYLEAAAALGDLHLDRGHTFGDLMRDDGIETSSWRLYLSQRAAANLARSTSDFRSIDPERLADDLPDTTHPAFVHLDAFAGNMLTDGSRITAVIDVGATSVAGDRRLDPLSAAVYLASPEITPTATTADIDVAMGWLRAAGLDQWFEPARRWLAAYWSCAVDDADLLRWCRSVLVGHG